jgi:hypothetical protein
MNLEPRLDLPANARLFSVPSAGSDLAVLEVIPLGEPIATVQLVHGFTGSKEDFWELAPVLADITKAHMPMLQLTRLNSLLEMLLQSKNI